jgi:hypothetical protein
MTADRSPFLSGALNWVYRSEVPPAACPGCGDEWSSPPSDALDAIRRAPARYAELLDGRDGMTRASDSGGNHHQLDVEERAAESPGADHR